MVGDLVRARPGDQGAESLEECPGREDHVSAAVRVGVAQAQEDAALFGATASAIRESPSAATQASGLLPKRVFASFRERRARSRHICSN